MAEPDPFHPDSAATERIRINFAWLLRLRRAGVLGQLLTIAVVSIGLDVDLHLLPLLTVVALGLVLNFGLQVWYFRALRDGDDEKWRREGTMLLGVTMLADVLLLTALLFVSGGIGNPFWFFYIVNLVLATVVLGGVWMAIVYVAAVASVGGLLFSQLPLYGVGGPIIDFAPPGELAGIGDISLYAKGAFVSFVAVATFTAYFVRTINAELARREGELDRERQRRADAARLEALANLAAGAAHELASPLSTIAVVAKELERALERSEDVHLREDAQLVRREVTRCREILDQMSLDAGESVGEQLVALPTSQLIEAAVGKLEAGARVRISFEGDAADRALLAPRTALTRAVRGLIKNGLDASNSDAGIAVTISPLGSGVTIEVADAGTGMDAATLERAVEPFFTTKDPGSGMGLGLFLTRTLAERLGGRLVLDSEPGRGTVARLELPESGVSVPATAPRRRTPSGIFRPRG
ncbi:sensor histidine kinase [Engelhardtia mirabilis]|uniref:histidine kinase n=1 Tax=Engelhardtia mirabilis TaxID=2528011 RepID=A0A518BH20_9BACT|nr:Sensor histidine kinase RegB [Planctomycetes bacterium Pla133]QDV00591.1 Sensor histidine kinase RegB [Planctomycetes bacterium Pla86]